MFENDGINTDTYPIFHVGKRYTVSFNNAQVTGEFMGMNKLGDNYVMVFKDENGALQNIVTGYISAWSEEVAA